MLGKKEQTIGCLFTSNKLYNASNILVRRGITKSYCVLLYTAKGNFKNSKPLLTEAERYAQTLASPMFLGTLERIKATLIRNYLEEFTDMISEGSEACCTSTKKYIGHPSGAYELYLPLELVDTTI